MQKIRELMKKKVVRYGAVVVALIAIMGGVAYNMQPPPLPEYIDEMEQEKIKPDSALDETPAKTTTSSKTSSKTEKKKVTLSKAATRTYTKNLGTKTNTSTKKSSSSNATVTTETKTQVTTKEKYTKGKKVKTVTTTTKTTITTTTTVLVQASKNSATSTSTSNNSATTGSKTADSTLSVASSSSTGNSVRSEAPLMDSRILSAYETLGFKVVIDPTFALGEGYFNAKTRTITLTKSKSNHIYHELGHFLGFIAGNVDTSSSFKSIYNEEKGLFKGTYRGYAATSSSEFFAECVREYILHRNDLKSWCPKSYAAVEAAMNKITTTQVANVQKTYGKIWAAYA